MPGMSAPRMPGVAVMSNSNPMVNIRMSQIQQLYSFFPNIVVTGRTQTCEDHRIPLLLTRANQPLFCRVSIPFQFP